jgi:hypothetical protein
MGDFRFCAASFAACLALSGIQPAHSQVLVRDSASGDYVLNYTDLSGSLRTVRLETRDRVLPEISVSLASDSLGVTYRYTLGNQVGARQAIIIMDVPCPRADVGLSVSSPPSWQGETEPQDTLGSSVPCEFLFREQPLAAGAVLTDLVIRTGYLPGIADAHVFGSIDSIGLPTPVEDTPDTVYRLVDQVQGFRPWSGGRAIPVVAPTRSPAALAQVDVGLDSVSVDRAGSCAKLWIVDSMLCSSLGDTLDQAREALSHGDHVGTEQHLLAFREQLEANHGAGLSINDNAYWLLKTNVEFILSHIPTGGTVSAVYLAGSGGTANPPTLSLSADAPSGSTAKYQDSPSINFNGGNPWATVGTWTAAPTLTHGTLSALGDTHVWLGLQNSDDVGTNFDVRVEAWKNGTLVTAGETRCIQGLTRNANDAQEVPVPFMSFSPAPFDGTSDVLSLKVLTRVGTTETGASCGGHQNAVGLRLYFDATSRAAQLKTTF